MPSLIQAPRSFILSQEEICKFVGDGSNALIQRSISLSKKKLHLSMPLPLGIVNAIHAWYIRYYNAHPVQISAPYPKITELLQKLQERNIYLGIVSNKPSVICNKILEKFYLKQFFTSIIAQEDMQQLKPNPEGLKKAIYSISARIAHIDLSNLSIEPPDLYVSKEESDIQKL